jgi:hypothetical protein
MVCSLFEMVADVGNQLEVYFQFLVLDTRTWSTPVSLVQPTTTSYERYLRLHGTRSIG